MNRIITIVVILAVGAGIYFGTTLPDRAFEIYYKGNVQGVSKCIETHSNDLIESTTVRDFCTIKHEFKLNSFDRKMISGRASIDSKGLEAIVDNKTNAYVVTKLAFEAHIYDADGTRTVFKTEKRVWLEPSRTKTIRATYKDEIDFDLEDWEFCKQDEPESQYIKCKSWTISALFVIEL